EPMLHRHLADDRRVFEHFTHDASVIPVEFFPMWQRQFARLGALLERRGWHVDNAGGEHHEVVRRRIEEEGPLSPRDFESSFTKIKGQWTHPPHKRALEYLWYSGTLTTSHREKFIKFYDLTERVIPAAVRQITLTDDEQIDWLSRSALDRLAFGTEGEIQRFWDATDNTETKAWVAMNQHRLTPVEIQRSDGSWQTAVAPTDIEDRIQRLPSPTQRLRLLNPFDPLVRDRTRLERLFGFEYRVEMFVPSAQRRWGYYVYPLLEGDRFVGRIELKADRKAGQLNLLSFWPEAGVKWSDARYARLQAEVDRLARFAGVNSVRVA
ncbi:MAG: crosslink repair DNA glycosylase YcaQ family protein, partial [Pseudomonadota bacterium]